MGSNPCIRPDNCRGLFHIWAHPLLRCLKISRVLHQSIERWWMKTCTNMPSTCQHWKADPAVLRVFFCHLCWKCFKLQPVTMLSSHLSLHRALVLAAEGVPFEIAGSNPKPKRALSSLMILTKMDNVETSYRSKTSQNQSTSLLKPGLLQQA